MKHIATIILCSSALLMACRGGNDDAELGHQDRKSVGRERV